MFNEDKKTQKKKIQKEEKKSKNLNIKNYCHKMNKSSSSQ